MNILEFKYTKDDGKASQRTFIEISPPNKNYFGIDISELDIDHEINSDIISKDFLKFKDTKKYSDRLKDTTKKSGLKDAIRTAFGKSNGKEVVIASMDFGFIGGSWGNFFYQTCN